MLFFFNLKKELERKVHRSEKETEKNQKAPSGEKGPSHLLLSCTAEWGCAHQLPSLCGPAFGLNFPHFASVLNSPCQVLSLYS